MKSRRILAVLCVAQVCLICALAMRLRGLNVENRELLSQSHVLIPKHAPELESIEKENGRLKAELATIPALSGKIEQYQKESVVENSRAVEFWTQRSNAIQTAIAQKQNEIREIEEWGKDFDQAKMRERAAARLAKKASAGTKTREELAEEYAQTEQILRNIATRTVKMREIQQQWRDSGRKPEDREEFKTNVGAAWREVDAAMKKLGDDSELFEEMPHPSENADLSKAPFYRSVIPDLHGVTATLYFDGTVVWSPSLPEALAKIK